MSSWQGRSKGNKTGYQIFVWVLRNFGVLPAYFLLRFVAFYFFLFSYRSSRQVYHVYRHKLGYGRFASIRKIYHNYYMLGQGLIDKVVVMSGIKNKFTYHFDGEENLREIASLKKGGILLSAHIGNWDIAGYLLKRLGTKINIIMYDGEQEQIKQYMDAVTGGRNMNIIFIKDDLSHIYEISEAFKRNELLCMHADRFVEGNKTMTMPFMGAPARFPAGPFVLATTFKVPVSFVFAVKESNFHYHLFGSKIKNYDYSNKTAVQEKMLEEFAKEMETMLRQYPGQWFNYYDFWAPVN